MLVILDWGVSALCMQLVVGNAKWTPTRDAGRHGPGCERSVLLEQRIQLTSAEVAWAPVVSHILYSTRVL